MKNWIAPNPIRIAFTVLSLVRLCAQVNVTTQHNDISRTGQNTNEVVLTPQNVSSGSFGKLFSATVDGAVSAQPLYLSGVSVPGLGTHNLLFIATEHDSVYALDADAPMLPLWQASLLDAAHGAAAGAIPEPSSDIGCTNISPEYGVTGTPVIDPATGTIYLVAVTSENGYPVQRLHALDVTTGAEKFGAPVTIKATLPGTGTGSSNGLLSFDPKWQLQRTGLLLINNNVYLGYGSHCDFAPYHGWVFGYNASTLAQSTVLLTTPNGAGSGTWMGGAGLAADTTSTYPRMFVPTGNGTYDATLPYGTNNMDYGDDILQLTLNNGIKVTDAFTPFNQAAFQASDGDVSSGGVLILPDQAGPYTHLAVQLGKSGSIYVFNRDNLGGFNAGANKLVQEVDGQVGGLWGIPAYWNGNLYIWSQGSSMAQFMLTNGVLSSSPVAYSLEGTSGYGITPSISSNGNTNGIVWAIDYASNPAILTAHDALDIGNTLFSSSSNSARDSLGIGVRFEVPTVANGKVYAGANGSVDVYGLLPSADFGITASPGSISLNQGGNASTNVAITSLNGFNGSVTLTTSNLPAGITAVFSSGNTTSSSTLTLSASASVAVGSYSFNVIGTYGSIGHSTIVTLQVMSTSQADFSLSASPAAISLVPGSLVSNGIILAQINGFNATPTFSVAGLPAGVTPSFRTVSGTYYEMNLTASASAPAGNFLLTVTGTYGALMRTTSFSLTVSADPNFTSVELLANNSNKCLSVLGNSLIAGATVVQSACSGAPGQSWNLIALSGNTYKVVSVNSGLALSVQGQSYAPGIQVIQDVYSSTVGQQWLFEGTPWGFYYVPNANTGQCLDVAGASGADGAPVDQAGCIGTLNQMWSIQPAPAAAGPANVQVNLSSVFNVDAIVADGTIAANGGLGLSYALSSSLVGTSVSWNQNPFSFGAANLPNAVSGTTITLPSGQFSSVQFLALAVYGGQPNQAFAAVYTDGSRTVSQQSISDWGSPQNYPGESEAINMPYRVAPDGSRSYGPWYLYGYSLPLNNGKTIQYLQLPANPNVFVFAVTLVK